MANEGFTQREIAADVPRSQATVSRITREYQFQSFAEAAFFTTPALRRIPSIACHRGEIGSGTEKAQIYRRAQLSLAEITSEKLPAGRQHIPPHTLHCFHSKSRTT